MKLRANARLARIGGALAVFVTLVLAWQLVAELVTAKGSYGEPLVPGW